MRIQKPAEILVSKVTGRIIETPISFSGTLQEEQEVLQVAKILADNEIPVLVDISFHITVPESELLLLRQAGYKFFNNPKLVSAATSQYEVTLVKPAQILSETQAKQYKNDHYTVEASNAYDGQTDAFDKLVRAVREFRQTNSDFQFQPAAFTTWVDLRELITTAHHRRGLPLPSVIEQTALATLRARASRRGQATTARYEAAEEKNESTSAASSLMFGSVTAPPNLIISTDLQAQWYTTTMQSALSSFLGVQLDAIQIAEDFTTLSITYTAANANKDTIRRGISYLSQLGIVQTSKPIKEQTGAFVVTHFDPSRLLQEAEYARQILLNMRKLLKGDAFKNLTSTMQLQRDLILKINILEFPLFMDEFGTPCADAYNLATQLLMHFRLVQQQSTANITDSFTKPWKSDDNASIKKWHQALRSQTMPISLRVHHDRLNADFGVQLAAAQAKYDDYRQHYDDRISPQDLIALGETARTLLNLIYEQSTLRRVGSGVRNRWPDHIRAQRELIESLGVGSNGLLEQQLVYDTEQPYMNKVAIERAKLLIDTVEDVYKQSRNAQDQTLPRYRTAETIAWHQAICASPKSNFSDEDGVAGMQTRFAAYIKAAEVRDAAKDNVVLPVQPSDTDTTSQLVNLTTTNPLDTLTTADFAKLMTCPLTGQLANYPVIFVDGRVYEQAALVEMLVANGAFRGEPPRGNQPVAVPDVDVQNKRKFYTDQFPVITNVGDALGGIRLETGASVYRPLKTSSVVGVMASAPSEHEDEKEAPPQQAIQPLAHALKGFIDVDFEGSQFVFVSPTICRITVAPNVESRYGHEVLSSADLVTRLQFDCSYLQRQGIISNFKSIQLHEDGPVTVQIYGVNWQNLLMQANAALLVLRDIYMLTDEAQGNFRRTTKSQRFGMDAAEDQGSLPTGVLAQRKFIEHQSSHLSDKAKRLVANPQGQLTHEDDYRVAFEILFTMCEVMRAPAQAQTKWRVSRDGSTTQWYGLFKPKKETRFTPYGHRAYEVLKSDDYAGLHQGITMWAQEHTKGLPVVVEEHHDAVAASELH